MPAVSIFPRPDRLTQLASWWLSPEGRTLWQREAQGIEDWLSRCFGYHALLLGLQPELLEQLQGLRIPHHFTLGPRAGTVRASFDALPLAAESVDLAVLHHVLEYALDPHQVLREVDRVLLPEGHMLLISFNPVGLWGWRALLRLGCKVPWCGQPLGGKRLNDWLGLLGYDVQAEAWAGYGCLAKGRVEHEAWFERWSARFMPRLGITHLMLARKRVSMPAPIRHRWSLIPTLGIKEGQAQARPSVGRQG